MNRHLSFPSTEVRVTVLVQHGSSKSISTHFMAQHLRDTQEEEEHPRLSVCTIYQGGDALSYAL